jgi:hypothetical protein
LNVTFERRRRKLMLKKFAKKIEIWFEYWSEVCCFRVWFEWSMRSFLGKLKVRVEIGYVQFIKNTIFDCRPFHFLRIFTPIPPSFLNSIEIPTNPFIFSQQNSNINHRRNSFSINIR